MIKVTKKNLISTVAYRWKNQYFRNGQWLWSCHGSESVYLGLLELRENATEEDVEDVIRNDTWTRNRCSECGSDCEKVVVLGNDGHSISLCWICLERATRLL